MKNPKAKRQKPKPLKLTFKYSTSVYSKLPIPEASLHSTLDAPNVLTSSGKAFPKLSLDSNSNLDDASSLKEVGESNYKVSKQASQRNIKKSLNKN